MKLPQSRPAPQMVALADIDVGTRLRPVSEAGVDAILSSIGETGIMKDAVHLRRARSSGGGDGRLVLIAGAHRLEAAKRLGWAEIEAIVWRDVSDDWVKLVEIDDNLAGAEMTALDTAVFLARRKAIYERLHPEARAGVFKGNRHTGSLVADIMSVTSFAKATAEKFGVTERHVRRMTEAGSALTDAQAQQLRAAPRAVGLVDLVDLSKIGDDAERAQVILKVATGQAKKVSQARVQYANETGTGARPMQVKADGDYDRLVEAWNRASPAARRRFVDVFGADLDAQRADDEGADA